MKNANTVWGKWAVCLICFGLSACGAQEDTMSAKLDGLEREMQRIRAENANLASRNQALDDKVLLYEKKQSTGDTSDAQPGLEVVRLRPGNTAGNEGYKEISMREFKEEDALRDEFNDSEGKKSTALRLVDYGSSSGYGDGSSTPVRSERAASIPATDRGDNLGVVAKGVPVGLFAEGEVPGASGETREDNDDMANFNVAYRAYSNNNYEAALAGFASFLKNHPDHSYADNAIFWRGESYLAQGKLLKAIGEFERLIKRYPGSDQSASALYRIGFIYDRLSDMERAREYYFKVVERHPESEAARKASRRMAALETAQSTAATIATSVKR